MVAGGMATVVVVAMIVTAWTWPILNEVETGATPEYPELQPHYYSTEPARIHEEAKAAVEELQRWEVVDADPASLRVDAERTTRLGFVDDITIRAEPVTEFVSRVHVRSASRVGQADLGQNARNINEFFDELQQRLGAVQFDPAQADVEDDEAQPDSSEDVTGEG